MNVPSLEDIRQAAERIQPLARKTPVLRCDALDEATSAHCFLKAENLQRTGSFKLRGATNAVSLQAVHEPGRPVLTFSSGNHGAALSCAAQHFGLPATVVMPVDAPESKKSNVARFGGTIVSYDPATEKREEVGSRLVEESGAALIPPFDNLEVICGQGTVGLEMTDQCPELDLVLVCLGGGGLLSGTCLSVKRVWPGCRVIGVEPANADDGYRSFHSGELKTVHNPQTVADGARTSSLGALTFPILQDWADDVVTVTEEEIVGATRFLWERAKIVSEPTGALATAGLLSGKVKAEGRRVGIVVTGGNCDLATVHGLFASMPG